MNTMTEAIVTIATAIIGLAIVATLVSKNAQTPQVIQASGSAFSNALGVAESPVTGQGYSLNLSYPGSSGAGLDFSGSFGLGS
jgi:PRD1 phage membrane DNA delivery